MSRSPRGAEAVSVEHSLPWSRPGILVGVDGSDGAVDALAYAAALAPRLGIPVHAVTVWDYPAAAYQDPAYPAEFAAPIARADRALQIARERVFAADPPAWFTESRVRGYPTAVLVELSAQSDMLAVGTRGLGGFAGLLLGSVSAACAAHAHCSVLVVHPQAESSRRSRRTRSRASESSS